MRLFAGSTVRSSRSVSAAVVALALLTGCSSHPESRARTSVPSASRYPVPAADSADPCLSAEQRAALVRFRSGNGALLTGLPLGRGERGVVLAHQSGGSLCDWIDYGQSLTDLGYTVFVFDLNGRGLSQPSDDFFTTPRDDADVVAAAAQLRERGVRSVTLMGASAGATAVVAAAPHIKGVAGVVEISGDAAAQGVDALGAAPRLRVPLLCLAAAGETAVARDARRLCDAATSATSAETVIVPDTYAHGTLLLDPHADPHADEVRSRLEAFLAG
jgi:dienelactone hydrolase